MHYLLDVAFLLMPGRTVSSGFIIKYYHVKLEDLKRHGFLLYMTVKTNVKQPLLMLCGIGIFAVKSCMMGPNEEIQPERATITLHQ